MARYLLQVTNVLLALTTIALAGASLIFGIENPIYSGTQIQSVPALDSNLRFMGGMGLGLGGALLWITPTIERQGTIFRLVWICALLGGVGRLISIAVVGMPAVPMIVFTAIEIPAVPLLIYWQHSVAKAYTPVT